MLDLDAASDFDREHIIHPYSACHQPSSLYYPPLFIQRAAGVYLYDYADNSYIDGMASWWSAVHGYNHPALNLAISKQLQQMAHVMFGGISHAPAVNLAQQLLQVAPAGLDAVFFADSGSVAIEAALKLAIQYWHSQGQPQKQKFISLRHGYHGDTLGAMSISDPENGMHQLFKTVLPPQIHLRAPPMLHQDQQQLGQAVAELEQTLASEHQHIAALVLEPLVQGAGGMRFYSASYLQQASALCTTYNVLLIADEIATGFGRTGSYFACEQANISPDIMCVGKALTGGYMSLAACLISAPINQAIGSTAPHVFMHGPTFMANPLACSVALASLELLKPYLHSDNKPNKIKIIEQQLNKQLEPCASLAGVANVRVLGAIGVVELQHAVHMATIVPLIIKRGIWLRPFGKLIYIMPPYTISSQELDKLCSNIYLVLQEYLAQKKRH